MTALRGSSNANSTGWPGRIRMPSPTAFPWAKQNTQSVWGRILWKKGFLAHPVKKLEAFYVFCMYCLDRAEADKNDTHRKNNWNFRGSVMYWKYIETTECWLIEWSEREKSFSSSINQSRDTQSQLIHLLSYQRSEFFSIAKKTVRVDHFFFKKWEYCPLTR